MGTDISSQLTRALNEHPASNFSGVVTSLIGRSAATRLVRDLISAYRVVTLTGPGGIGKTSLAIKAARGLLPDFEGGGWLVELASLSDPGLVPSAVASVLGLRLGGEEISAEVVARAIGGSQILLLLDNCEHVIGAVAAMAEVLVGACPRVTILTTSQEVLRIDGENIYRVPPLEVPSDRRQEANAILDHSAVELFITRAKSLGTDFSPRAEDLSVIGAICRRLDGIPLAIEFAASRAAVLGIEPVAAGLRDRFALLTGGRRTALPRHRTLRATLDWSHELLPDAERRLLRRLAVFPAGFTIEGAFAVMRDTGLDAAGVTDGVANLVSKSLVALDGSATRWFLLETTRAYALEKLSEHGEAAAAARHHAAHFRDRLAPLATGAGSRITPDELAPVVREIDNVRAALDWSFSAAGDRTTGIALTAAFAPVWVTLSLLAECRDRCEQAIRGYESEPAIDARVRMWLQVGLATALIDTMGPAEQTRRIAAAALETADTLNDPDGQARALITLATTSIFRGDYAGARAASERAARIARGIGDPAIVRVTDRIMGITMLNIGHPAEARRNLEGALRSPVPAEGRPLSLWYPWDHLAPTRALLARALWLRGFADQARVEGLASLDEVLPSDRKIVFCLTAYFGICRIAPMTGDFATAERANARFLDVATGLNAPFWSTVGRFLEGRLLVTRGEFTDGLAVLRDAFAVCSRTGWQISFPEFKCSLAAALAGLGQYDEALAAVNEGLADANTGGEQWYLAELLRVKGKILQQGNADSEAEQCLTEALTVAQTQEAMFWELRAGLSLARLWAARGRREEASRALLPLYGRFTEGFETTDLRAAKTLLDELAG
jgi:predicted ATPase